MRVVFTTLENAVRSILGTRCSRIVLSVRTPLEMRILLDYYITVEKARLCADGVDPDRVVGMLHRLRVYQGSSTIPRCDAVPSDGEDRYVAILDDTFMLVQPEK